MRTTYDFLRDAGLTSELHSLEELQSVRSEETHYYCNSVICTTGAKGYVTKHGRHIGEEEVDICPACGYSSIVSFTKTKKVKVA